MKFLKVLGLEFLFGVAGYALGPAAASTALTFGDAHLTVPAGWRHVETESGPNKAKVLLIVPPADAENRKLAILVMPGQDLQGDFPQTFDAILKKALAPNEHVVQYSDLPVRKTPEYDFLTRSMVVADDAGHRSVRVCFGANPGHRLEMLIVSADSKETLQHYQAEVSSLLGSYSFGETAASSGTNSEESGTTTSAVGAESGAPAEQGSSSETNPNAQGSHTAGSPKIVANGPRAHVPDGESVLLCTDSNRLDGAMDFAKYGDSYNALRALRNDAFFRVNGPATLAAEKFEMKSRWPKVFVTVLDGDFAGRTGWVVLSELKDLKPPSK